MKKIILVLLVMTLSLALLVGCGDTGTPAPDGGGQEEAKPEIVVGSKNFTEQLLVGYMVGALMEDEGYPVNYKLRLGGTGLVHESLVNGDVNVYVEYTGTGLIAILGEDVMSDPDAVYDVVKEKYLEEYNLVWLEPWGFNNTYTITMRQDEADELGVSKISDLKDKAGDLVIGATQEFIPRSDGLAGLQDMYGFKFKNALGMDSGLMYQALQEKKVNAISGFATDGRIPAFGFINLEDDLNYFPPYYAAPVVRADLLEQDPAIADVLNKLAGQLDDTTMANLNYEVDGDKKDPEDVAIQFLKDKGLIN